MRRLCGRSRFAGFRPVGLARLLVACGLVALSVLTGSAASAAPDRPTQAGPPEVTVVKVSGPLDPVLADFVEQSIDQAEERDAAWVVFWMNSAGTVVPDERVAELVERVRTADVPVGIWVGQSRARAQEGAGAARPRSPTRWASGCAAGSATSATRWCRQTASRPPYRAALDRLRDGTVDAEAAEELGLIEAQAPNIGDFLISLDGVETTEVADRRRAPPSPAGRGVPVAAARQPVHAHGGQPAGRLPAVHLRHGPHRVRAVHRRGRRGRPGRAPGPSCSAATAWPCCPTRPFAVALLVLSMLAFAIDVQTGVPRVWTGIGAGAPRGRLVPALRRGVDLLDHAAGRDRRRAPVHARRHAGHGPHPVLHADDRAGLDDRRGGRGRGRRSRPTAWSRSAARCGGPGPTGRRPSRPATPYVWSRSTVCCSRSSPSKGRPRTTGTDGKLLLTCTSARDNARSARDSCLLSP